MFLTSINHRIFGVPVPEEDEGGHVEDAERPCQFLVFDLDEVDPLGLGIVVDAFEFFEGPGTLTTVVSPVWNGLRNKKTVIVCNLSLLHLNRQLERRNKCSGIPKFLFPP